MIQRWHLDVQEMEGFAITWKSNVVIEQSFNHLFYLLMRTLFGFVSLLGFS